ncbi:hypothetical protein, partial [Acinetobacter seifertii]|uniref:hypothetical protein n=1 Tax=Acinetobacter seifertii TaxID=1530123 RepID=UPI00190394EF
MRNLKYFIFILITICSTSSFAARIYYGAGQKGIKEFTSASAFCSSVKPDKLSLSSIIDSTNPGLCIFDGDYEYRVNFWWEDQPDLCPKSGWPIPVYFEPGSPIPLQTCKKNSDGTYCVTQWTGDKNKPIVISGNNYQSITHASVSQIPSPTCTPIFSQDSCNSKDPYGGCYKPPNDNCNRMSDGSIYCPDGTPPPPIKSGCQNNATYCDMPPTGCGSGYVPGSYNGKQVCVLNSNPPPTDPKDPPPPTDPKDPPPPTDPKDPPPPTDPKDPPPPPPPPPTSNNDALLRAIIEAINAVNNKLTWVKNEIVNAVNNVSNKLDVSNQKLDTVNNSVKETTGAVNANGDLVKKSIEQSTSTLKTAVDDNTAATNDVKTAVVANTSSTSNKLNDVVNAINNKPVGSGGTTNVDLTETNGYLKDIKEFLGAADSSPAEDGKLNIVQQEIDTNFNGSLFKVSGTCPPP